jgi:hypothetical protein
MTTTDADLVGKHGTFTNGDQRITGFSTEVYPASFAVKIDGADSRGRTWLPRDNWDFTPDPAPFPTEPGVYVLASHNLADCPVLAVLHNGHWRVSLSNGAPLEDPDGIVRAWHGTIGLVRLVREDGNA